MSPPTLPRLWTLCLLLIALLLAWLTLTGPARLLEARKPAAPPQPAAEPPPTQGPAPSYTFIGEHPARVSGHTPANRKAPQPAPPQPEKRRPAGGNERTRKGRIPDLQIGLGTHNLPEVIAHFGFVPAVKTRTHVLGKIAGGAFHPLAPNELERFARRGRAGSAHPQAQAWIRRIAAELHLPADSLRFILLVPRAVEATFLAAQARALRRAGLPAEKVLRMQAHYAPDFEVAITALITTDGRRLTLPPNR